MEVKAGKTSITDIIQQIKVYHTYYPRGYYVVATLYPITALEKETLQEEGIKHIYVKEEDVRDFLSAQKSMLMTESF